MSGATGRREVAHRLFATEYDDASLEYAESDEERAPNYVVTPTGARVNRAFVVGVLTSVEQVNEDTVRARIADPTGAFVVYAGQYQPDELAALQSVESPAFVAITGKANTFQPDGSDRVLTSIRPESVIEVDAETRDRWAVTAAEHTLGRIETAAEALAREERGDELVAALRRDGVDPSLAEGVARALEHYDTTADYLGTLREVALQAVEVVAGERSEAESLDVEPDASTGTYAAGDLQDSAPDAAAAVTDVAGPIEDVEIDDVEVDSDGADAEEAAEADETAADQTAADETPTSASGETEASTTGEAETPSSDESAESAPDETAAVSEETTAASEEMSEAETASASAETAEPDAASSEDESTDGARDVDDGDVEEQADADDTAEQLDADDDVDDGEDADPEDLEDVVDDEERERIEEEYGVGFESGAEVGEPGEADIDAPDDAADDEGTAGADAADEAGETADADDAADADAPTDASEDADDAAAPESDDASDETDAGDAGNAGDAGDAGDADDASDVDLEAALLDQMADMDGDDGAERAALVDAVAADTGADESAVEDAIEDALMSGKCYEPSEGVYKPI